MRVLITGGGGLVGQAIAKAHVNMGDEVFIYDTRLNRFNDYSNLVGTDVSIKDKERKLFYTIDDIIKRYDKFDVISHQAALVGVGQSQYDIYNYVNNNVLFTASLIQALLDSKKFPDKIIHAGSMGPYGSLTSDIFSATENCIQDPQSIYAVTKQAQENLLKIFSHAYNVQCISLRYFSVYSTDQNPLNPYTGIISIIANQLLNNDVVELYGDGNQTRDLINVNDVARAHYLASITSLSEIFCPINIGSGVSYSLNEIAHFMRDCMGIEKPIVFNGKYRSGDIKYMRADITKADRLLKWKPKYNLYDDIKRYCKFVIENKEKFSVNTVKEEQVNLELRGLVHGGS